MLLLACSAVFAQDQSGAGHEGMQFQNFSVSSSGPGAACNCSTLNVTGPTQLLGPVNIVGGPTQIVPPPSMIGGNVINNMSVNGSINVKAFGAKGDGLTDDTAAIQAAADRAANHACVYFPPGTYIVTQDLNFTSFSGQSRCIEGEDPSTTAIICEDTGGNCLDLSGSDAFSVRNIQLQGGSTAANAPKTIILLARAGNGQQGFGHTMENVWTASTAGHSIGGNPPFTIYDYGAELAQWRNVRSNTGGVVFSACNHPSITSKFQTLVAPGTTGTSMSIVNVLGGNLNAGNGGCAVLLDDNCGTTTANEGQLHDIYFWGTFFGEMGGGGTALCDNGSYGYSLLQLIGVYGSRLEASDNNTNYTFVNFQAYTNQLQLKNDNIGSLQPETVPGVQIYGYIDNSEIELDDVLAAGTPLVKASGGRADTFLANPALVQFTAGDPQSEFGNTFRWFDGVSPFYGHVDAGGASANEPPVALNGTTAGSLRWVQPMHGFSWKTVSLYFNGYENTTTTEQNFVFPHTFLAVPYEVGSCPAGMTWDGATLHLPTSMAAAFTGQCALQGQ
jgi:hypothetical protein